MSRKKTQNKTNSGLERISSYYNLTNDESLALFYGVSESTISAWRTRNKVNEALVRAKCNDDNLANWFMSGNKTYDPQSKTIEPANLIQEVLAPYLTPATSSPDNSPDVQNAVRYAVIAFEILTSKTGYANALRENITWFREAVEDRKRAIQLKEDFELMKKKLSESGIL